jgi:hypothetical protein
VSDACSSLVRFPDHQPTSIQLQRVFIYLFFFFFANIKVRIWKSAFDGNDTKGMNTFGPGERTSVNKKKKKKH